MRFRRDIALLQLDETLTTINLDFDPLRSQLSNIEMTSLSLVFVRELAELGVKSEQHVRA